MHVTYAMYNIAVIAGNVCVAYIIYLVCNVYIAHIVHNAYIAQNTRNVDKVYIVLIEYIVNMVFDVYSVFVYSSCGVAQRVYNVYIVYPLQIDKDYHILPEIGPIGVQNKRGNTGDRVTFDNEFSLMKGRFQGSNCTVVAKAEVVAAAAIKFAIRRRRARGRPQRVPAGWGSRGIDWVEI